MVQPDISAVTPEDVRTYKLGSILAGGNSSPRRTIEGAAAEWLKLADAFWNASQVRALGGRQKIPLIYGHRRGARPCQYRRRDHLSAEYRARRDARSRPDTPHRRGHREEMAVNRLRLGFLADPGGRPRRPLGADLRRLLRGPVDRPLLRRDDGRGPARPRRDKAFLGAGHVIATAKHFVGDGGTAGGKDQGDNPSSPAQLRDIHGAGYPPAIEAGVQAVMASFSWSAA